MGASCSSTCGRPCGGSGQKEPAQAPEYEPGTGACTEEEDMDKALRSGLDNTAWKEVHGGGEDLPADSAAGAHDRSLSRDANKSPPARTDVPSAADIAGTGDLTLGPATPVAPAAGDCSDAQRDTDDPASQAVKLKTDTLARLVEAVRREPGDVEEIKEALRLAEEASVQEKEVQTARRRIRILEALKRIELSIAKPCIPDLVQALAEAEEVGAEDAQLAKARESLHVLLADQRRAEEDSERQNSQRTKIRDALDELHESEASGDIEKLRRAIEKAAGVPVDAVSLEGAQKVLDELESKAVQKKGCGLCGGGSKKAKAPEPAADAAGGAPEGKNKKEKKESKSKK